LAGHAICILQAFHCFPFTRGIKSFQGPKHLHGLNISCVFLRKLIGLTLLMFRHLTISSKPRPQILRMQLYLMSHKGAGEFRTDCDAQPPIWGNEILCSALNGNYIGLLSKPLKSNCPIVRARLPCRRTKANKI